MAAVKKTNDEVRREAIDALLKEGDPDVGEVATFTDLAVAFVFTANKWEKLGEKANGVLRILKNTKNNRYRLIMRSKDCESVLFNFYLLPEPDMAFSAADGAFMIKTPNYVPGNYDTEKKSYKVKFINKQISDDFMSKMTEAITANKALRGC